jgi:hypothetical protein
MQTSEFVLEKELRNLFTTKIGDSTVVERLTEEILRGSTNGLEVNPADPKQSQLWFKDRFEFQLVWLDENDYSRALVRALWLAPKFVSIDFGGGRQRDFAQLWTDTARGFLGEIALKKFVEGQFGIRIESETRRGNIEEFLPSDIKIWDEKTSKWRDSKLKVSIKTTKFNGVWLDVGSQFPHSDVFILIKIGIARLHYLAFMKQISFLKDKLFTRAKDWVSLTTSRPSSWREVSPHTRLSPPVVEAHGRTTILNRALLRIDNVPGFRPSQTILFSGVTLAK